VHTSVVATPGMPLCAWFAASSDTHTRRQPVATASTTRSPITPHRPPDPRHRSTPLTAGDIARPAGGGRRRGPDGAPPPRSLPGPRTDEQLVGVHGLDLGLAQPARALRVRRDAGVGNQLHALHRHRPDVTLSPSVPARDPVTPRPPPVNSRHDPIEPSSRTYDTTRWGRSARNHPSIDRVNPMYSIITWLRRASRHRPCVSP
jgi:hypothetical protein